MSQIRLSPDGSHLGYVDPRDPRSVILFDSHSPSASPRRVRLDLPAVRLDWAGKAWLVAVTRSTDGRSQQVVPLAAEGQASVVQLEGSYVQLAGVEDGHVVVGAPRPDRTTYYRVDLASGAREEIPSPAFPGETFFAGKEPRLAVRWGNNIAEWFWRKGDTWAPLFVAREEELAMGTRLLQIAPNGKSALFLDGALGDTLQVVQVDLETGARKAMTHGPADILRAMVEPGTGVVQASLHELERPKWTIQSDAVARDLAFLERQDLGVPDVLDRSQDDRAWIVAFLSDRAPRRIFLYDRTRSALEDLHLADAAVPAGIGLETRAIPVLARDGARLIGYSTRDRCAPADIKSAVLLVHGGPSMRDSWAYDRTRAWLASRGYEVVSVNFRGSRGFGKSFEMKAVGAWGTTMQTDLDDALDAIRGRDSRRPVAIMGASYGGYAAMNAVSISSDKYACAVSYFGSADLRGFVRSAIASNARLEPDLHRRVGDPDTESGAAELERRSPISRASEIRVPLFVAAGGKDPFAPIADTDRLVSKLSDLNRRVVYLTLPDEHHGFSTSERRLALYGAIETFLSRCLGGLDSRSTSPDLLSAAGWQVRAGESLIRPAPGNVH